MNKVKRNVTYRNQASTSIVGGSGYGKKEKAAIRTRERMNRIAYTKAKQYLILAVAAILLSQVIKYLAQNVLFTTEQSTSSGIFLVFFYLQAGLLLSAFLCFVMAGYKALSRIFREIG